MSTNNTPPAQGSINADGLPPLPEPLECISIAEDTIVVEADDVYSADQMRAYVLADRAARQSAVPGEVNWLICERIGNEDHVNEALRAFSEDSTQDNATGVIQAALTVYLADTATLATPAPSERVPKTSIQMEIAEKGRARDAQIGSCLQDLMGNWEHGSDTPIRLFQDKITRTFRLVLVNGMFSSQHYFGESLYEVVLKAWEDKKPIEHVEGAPFQRSGK